MLLKTLLLESFVKNMLSTILSKKQETVLLKQPYQNDTEKTAARNVSQKFAQQNAVGKKLRNIVAKNNRTEMLLRKLPLETFVKNIRKKMLSKITKRKLVANNNRTEMLLKSLKLETFVNKMRLKCCRAKY